MTNQNQKNNKDFTHEQRINYLSSFPPIIQFVGVVLGVILEFIFPTKLFPVNISQTLGIIFIVLSTLLIFWSQKASAGFRAGEKKGHAPNFSSGPYKWSDNPTSFSLAILVVGFGFLMNSLMVVIFSAIGYLLSLSVYENKKKKIMTEKYKDQYVEYKKKVKSIF